MTQKLEKSFKDLHKSVLLHELVDAIEIKKSGQNIIVDCTLGMAGHAREILKKMNKGDIFVGFDADIRNLSLVQDELEKEFGDTGIILYFVNDNFENLKKNLLERGITKITGIYYDLGMSSLHVDQADRGFSFKLDGPLDMRFDTSKGKPASTIVNSYSKDELMKIFREYGEEPSAKRIAEEIVSERRKGMRFKTTHELSDLIGKISRFPKSKTRIFQALRIETNKELDVIGTSMTDAIEMLEKGGIIFAISFHSLEDRIVKNIFKREERDCICSEIVCVCNHKKTLKVTTKKPILPSEEEMISNPRSRSAKARCARRM